MVAQIKFIKSGLTTLCILFLGSTNIWSETGVFQIGFFEGGGAPHHTLLRQEFRNAIERELPDEIVVEYAPYGFKSAFWNRDSCIKMAEQLVNESGLKPIGSRF